ncbi:MAG: hypothetical protein Q8O15_08740 [Rectinemataceae bacterium]|nr:hypothetical protein [Rectinemataceae bacterium]
MAGFVRCKACGYVMEKGKIGDKCPACGVPAKMFEDFDDRISARRRLILGSHIHPVIVHAPQGLAFIVLLLALFGLVFPVFSSDISTSIRVLCIVLPISAIGAFLSGLLDGKTRFRKVTTPLLVRKMIAGIVFLAASCVMLLLAPGSGIAVTGAVSGVLTANGTIIAFLAANLVAFGCSVVLGLWGAGLINAKFPG